MTFTRVLISGTSQLTLSNGAVRLISIVSTPILTNLLSPEAYGAAALAGTVISLMSVFGLAGIDMSYMRAYHSVEPPNGAAVEHYCWRFSILGALLASVFGAQAWWFLNGDSGALDRRLTILVAVGIIFSVADTMAQTRAALVGRYRAIALTILATGVIGSAASIGIAAIWRQDALALLLPMLIGYLMPVLLLGAPSIAGLVKPSGLTRNEGASLAKIGLAGVVIGPMYWLLTSSDRWFLQYYLGVKAVGVYSIGYSVAMVGMMINSAVTPVWRFEAAREYAQDPARAQFTMGKLMSRIVAMMAVAWLAVAAGGGDIVRWLAHERFHAAADYIPYLAGGVFFHGILHLANTNLLLAKQLSWGILWWLVGGLVCTLLNLVLVPRYGGLGAAVTQTASVGLISLATLATSQIKVRLDLNWSRLVTVLLVTFTTGVFLAPPWHATAPLSLLMKLPIGLLVALVTGWLVAPDWCGKGIYYLRRWAVS